MLHAMAFFNYIAELMSKVFSRHLLYELEIDIKEKIFQFRRVFVNPECLDIHFRLLRADKVSTYRTDASVKLMQQLINMF